MPQNEAPKAAIVVPHYNDVERLDRCLAALSSQVGGDEEVIVADNASTQDLSTLRDRHEFARFITVHDKGAACARNAGVAATTAPLLFFLDADCIPASDWVQTAYDVLDRAGVVGGRIDIFDETPPPKSGAEAFETVFAFHQKSYIQTKGFSVTANLLVPRKIFDAVGSFVPGVSEDLDWCLRAGALNYPISYADALRVGHPSRSDWSALKKKWQRLTAESYGLEGKGGTKPLRWALKALAMPVSAVADTPKVLGSDQLDTTEKWRGVATLFRLRTARMVWMLGLVVGIRP